MHFRFVYGNIPLHDAALEAAFKKNTAARKAAAKEGDAWESLPAPYEGELRRDDAWNTIMQGLYAKALELKAETLAAGSCRRQLLPAMGCSCRQIGGAPRYSLRGDVRASAFSACVVRREPSTQQFQIDSEFLP